LYAQLPPTRRGANRRTRLVVVVLIAALGIAGIAYMFGMRGGPVAGNEVRTASGLRYVDEVVGTGAEAQAGQKVSVHYRGLLESGTQFDSSRDPGKQPLEFVLGSGSMIKGFDEGVRGMKAGGKRRLVIPPQLGYGPAGRPPTIPGNATLIFEIELLKAG
jgi:FKBP-type peptidyl-prolyl cis-trans isomerase